MAKVTIKGIVSAATILEGKKHSINVADGMEFFARVRDITRDLNEEEWGVVWRYLRPSKRLTLKRIRLPKARRGKR